MSMNEMAAHDRVWRLHTCGQEGGYEEGAEPEGFKPENETAALAMGEAFSRDWREWLGRRLTRPVGFERTLQLLADDWRHAHDAKEIDQAFLERLRAFWPMARFELARAGNRSEAQGAKPAWSRRPGELAAEIAVHPDTPEDRLRVYHSAWLPGMLARRTLERVRLLCSLFGHAQKRLHLHGVGSSDDSDVIWGGAQMREQWKRACAAAAEPCHSAIVRDATFLSAILPFALAQAKRHREPLSLLCVAVDRLGGVENLLGRPAAEKLVTTVGEVVASMIRSSDIVCRLEDDRVVAVLPRAAAEDAYHVAQSVRHAIAASSAITRILPGLSVTASIGVASYPSHATNVLALFDAADQALAAANSLGPDHVSLVPMAAAADPPSSS